MSAPGSIRPLADASALDTAARTKTTALETAAKVDPPLVAAAKAQPAAAQYNRKTGAKLP